jgi:hypothetical protein
LSSAICRIGRDVPLAKQRCQGRIHPGQGTQDGAGSVPGARLDPAELVEFLRPWLAHFMA